MSEHHVLFFDFETYYDREYSLTKLDPPSYILDRRFEPIGCAVALDDAPSQFIDAPDLPEYFGSLDPAHTTTVAFNALFDNCILAWHYGFVPTRMYCSMRLVVALRGHLLRRHSLSAVAEALHIGTKGTTIQNAMGRNRANLMADRDLWAAYQDYAINDNDLNRKIFSMLLGEFPHSERRIMDRVLRCAVEPKFVVDTDMLREHLEDLHTLQVQTLIDAGADTTLEDPDRDAKLQEFSRTLRSNTKFKEVLEAHGVEVQYKASTTTEGATLPAFAKTDDFMAELQVHPDPAVQALAAARLDLRSTIEETRGRRMLNIAELPWSCYRDGSPRLYSGGTLPIPLKYSAAHTHRLGGDWSLNMQNLPSGRGQQKSKLRKALKAPPGFKVVVADKSQIECRINGWVCGQNDLLDIFRTGGDPYSVLASAIFSYLIDKNVHKIERFIGKGGELGLGFGCGAEKFYNMVVRQARTLGMDMKTLMAMWSPELAAQSVSTYRVTHSYIASTWRHLQRVLETAWLGIGPAMTFGPVRIGHGYVEGPSGLRMNYANPRQEVDEVTGHTELWYDYSGRRHRMYGSKFLENIVQFLARINTMHDALRISDRGYRFCMQSHDELVFIVPEAEAQRCLDVALEEMKRPPSWARDLPLNAEGNFGDSYGDAK